MPAFETTDLAPDASVTTEYGPVKDFNVNVGNTYIYRLKMIDKDGASNYSQELEVTYDATELAITKVTPNPVTNSSIINYTVPQEGNISAKLFDANGNAVKTIFEGASKAGSMSLNFDALGLSSGAYTLIITDGTSTATQQIRIQK